MSFKIESRQDEGYILLVHEGHMKADDMREAQRVSFEVARHCELNRIFVDITSVTHLPTTSEQYDVHIDMFNAKGNLPRGGIYLREDQESEMRLFADIAHNRGIPFRVFTDKLQALTWLLSDEE